VVGAYNQEAKPRRALGGHPVGGGVTSTASPSRGPKCQHGWGPATTCGPRPKWPPFSSLGINRYNLLSEYLGEGMISHPQFRR
jgi:hypothetical protein